MCRIWPFAVRWRKGTMSEGARKKSFWTAAGQEPIHDGRHTVLCCVRLGGEGESENDEFSPKGARLLCPISFVVLCLVKDTNFSQSCKQCFKVAMKQAAIKNVKRFFFRKEIIFSFTLFWIAWSYLCLLYQIMNFLSSAWYHDLLKHTIQMKWPGIVKISNSTVNRDQLLVTWLSEH